MDGSQDQDKAVHSQLDAGAIGINEVAESYERAGFSRAEAIELVKHHIWTNAHIEAENARWERRKEEI